MRAPGAFDGALCAPRRGLARKPQQGERRGALSTFEPRVGLEERALDPVQLQVAMTSAGSRMPQLCPRHRERGVRRLSRPVGKPQGPMREDRRPCDVEIWPPR